MRNIKLTIEYDGTGYHGWQTQINAPAVQDAIEKAIYKLTGERCGLTGSSRTDAGVHALGQVANFATSSAIPADKFSFALNNILPDDIVIKRSEEADINFHSRYSAKGKKYRYLMYNSVHPSALLRNRAYHVPKRLDLDLMKQAGLFLVGTHDFEAFKASGSSVKTNVRTITDLSLTANDEIIELEVAGNGFLYNMVRIVAGTLVEIGSGRIPAEGMPDIIKSRDRKTAGRTAPAHGLYLVEVYY